MELGKIQVVDEACAIVDSLDYGEKYILDPGVPWPCCAREA